MTVFESTPKASLPTLYVRKWICANLLKEDRIRSPKGPRICRNLSHLCRSLYRRGLSKVLESLVCRFGSSTGQRDLSEFDFTSSEDTPDTTGPVQQKSEGKSDPDTALIYARVSSAKQARDGYSIDTQLNRLTEIREERGIPLHCEPICDRGQTGGSFDRDGIERVFQEAQNDDVSYLLVQDVDRIGRSAAETLYFVYILQTECDVTLITTSGEKDVTSTEGLMQATLMSLMAQLNNELRMKKAHGSAIRRFIEDGNWRSKQPNIPLGYNETEDGWIEKDPDTVDVVRELFEEFVDCENYRKAGRRIEDRHGEVLDGHRVKTLLQEEAYKGKPQVSAKAAGDYQGRRVRDDPDLQIVSEELFEKAQEIIEKKNEIHSTDDSMNLADFVEEFDLFTVVEASPPVTLQCESCGGRVVKNGQRSLLDEPIGVHTYLCTKCGASRKWPRDDEFERMKLLYEHPRLPEILNRLR